MTNQTREEPVKSVDLAEVMREYREGVEMARFIPSLVDEIEALRLELAEFRDESARHQRPCGNGHGDNRMAWACVDCATQRIEREIESGIKTFLHRAKD